MDIKLDKFIGKTGILRPTLILAPFVMTLGMAMDIYIPSIPKMPKLLGTSAFYIQLTLSYFLIGFGVAQLLIGPICDYLGRRKTGTCSSCIFILGSIICSISPNVYILIIGRIIQAVGGCGCQIVAFAVAKDSLGDSNSKSVINYLRGIMGTAPITAPILGSFLDDVFSWRASFVFLALFGIIILILQIYYVPETLSQEKRVRFDNKIILRYFEFIKNSKFLMYCVSCLSAESVLFCFFSISPYIIIKILGYDKIYFSFLFGFNAIIYFMSSLISGRLISKIGSFKTMVIGHIILFIAGLLMTILHFYTGVSLFQFILPSYFASVGVAFVMGTSTTMAISMYEKTVGTATAAIGCIEFIMAGVIGNFMMSFSPIKNSLPEAVVLILSGIFPLVLIMSYKTYSVLAPAKSS